MSPPTVNAYYDPSQNNINFPAGILQPPFYNAKADDAVNYGAIGVVVGHELTHGFDDEGRRYDGEGNLRDWWTAEDAKKFTERAECVVSEYGTFSPVDGVNLNGKLTLGENAADNGGIHLAYMALMDHLAGKVLPKEDGFTQQQLFFLGFASGVVRERNGRQFPHAGRYRSTFTWPVPHQRYRTEHERIRAGFLLVRRAIRWSRKAPVAFGSRRQGS